jgi:hypothetical protein
MPSDSAIMVCNFFLLPRFLPTLQDIRSPSAANTAWIALLLRADPAFVT